MHHFITMTTSNIRIINFSKLLQLYISYTCCSKYVCVYVYVGVCVYVCMGMLVQTYVSTHFIVYIIMT